MTLAHLSTCWLYISPGSLCSVLFVCVCVCFVLFCAPFLLVMRESYLTNLLQDALSLHLSPFHPFHIFVQNCENICISSIYVELRVDSQPLSPTTPTEFILMSLFTLAWSPRLKGPQLLNKNPDQKLLSSNLLPHSVTWEQRREQWGKS